MAVRGPMHRAGAAALGRLLSLDTAPAPGDACGCGGQARWHSLGSRQLLTALGEVNFQRAYYVCPDCHSGHCPRDRELEVEAVQYSPGVQRMLALVGSESSFEQGREQGALLAGLEVTAKAVERPAEAIGADGEAHQQQHQRRAQQLELPAVYVPTLPLLYIEMDGTGVPVVKAETEDRAGKVRGPTGAHTRSQTGLRIHANHHRPGGPSGARPGRHHLCRRHGGVQEFGLRLYTEAWRRGWSRAERKVVIGDGAVWIWNLARQHFPGSIEIVDLYHARQHLWELSAQLFPRQPQVRKPWMGRGLKLLDQGQVEPLVKILRDLHPDGEELVRWVRNQAEYFERNAQRMRYPAFRAQGLFVGSGVVEAGCKTVIGARLKRSGMFWTVCGANAIIALRCSRLSHRFEDYWESRSRAA